MKIIKMLRKYAATGLAFAALMVANATSAQFSYIFFQEEIPQSLKKNKM